MGNERIDPEWARLLSLAVHEFRTPITVVAGYLRMVLKERAGPISEQQRKLLEEAEKSCGRLSGLVAEMSDLSSLESGKVTFNRSPVDLSGLLREEIASLPELPDRTVAVLVEAANDAVMINGDATRLRTAFAALLNALRREVVTTDRLIARLRTSDGAGICVVAIGEPDAIDGIASADVASLRPFDEWRGGSGLSLAVARRVFTQHGGTLYAPPSEGKAGAVLFLSREGVAEPVT